jgi:hypothetical protein
MKTGSFHPGALRDRPPDLIIKFVRVNKAIAHARKQEGRIWLSGFEICQKLHDAFRRCDGSKRFPALRRS